MDLSDRTCSFLIQTLQPRTPPGSAPGQTSIYQPLPTSHSHDEFERFQQPSIPTPVSPDQTRPYVTLTFAQSLDAKIAGKGGKQLILSGKESMVMTHWMRTLHDGIMIGIGTALNDNPQLNTRHLPPLSSNPIPNLPPLQYHLPRPIILDTYLRFSTDCKLLKNYHAGTGRRPWVVSSPPENDAELGEWKTKRASVEKAGARVIEVPSSKIGHIHIPSLLKTLCTLGIRSLMVEGGAQIIKSFLSASKPTPSNTHGLVDTIIITVAPVLVGDEGIGYSGDLIGSEVPNLEHLKTEVFGKDVVMALKVL